MLPAAASRRWVRGSPAGEAAAARSNSAAASAKFLASDASSARHSAEAGVGGGRARRRGGEGDQQAARGSFGKLHEALELDEDGVDLVRLAEAVSAILDQFEVHVG